MTATTTTISKLPFGIDDNALLRLILKPSVLDQLEKADKLIGKPFANDIEFLTAFECVFVSQNMTLFLLRTFQNNFVLQKELLQNPKMIAELALVLEQITCKLRETVHKRLQITRESGTTLPRVIRLAEKLSLTAKETIAFVFIAVAQFGIG